MSKCELCINYSKCGDQEKIKCPLFKIDKEKPYFDKFNHAERSIVNAPQHIKHWSKIKRNDGDNNR